MIYFIVENTGAGKTSYCKKLKQETKGIVFSIDQWNNSLFMPDKNSLNLLMKMNWKTQ